MEKYEEQGRLWLLSFRNSRETGVAKALL